MKYSDIISQTSSIINEKLLILRYEKQERNNK